MTKGSRKTDIKPTYDQLEADYRLLLFELKRIDRFYINDICQQAWAYDAEISELKQALAAAYQLIKAPELNLN